MGKKKAKGTAHLHPPKLAGSQAVGPHTRNIIMIWLQTREQVTSYTHARPFRSQLSLPSPHGHRAGGSHASWVICFSWLQVIPWISYKYWSSVARCPTSQHDSALASWSLQPFRRDPQEGFLRAQHYTVYFCYTGGFNFRKRNLQNPRTEVVCVGSDFYPFINLSWGGLLGIRFVFQRHFFI